MSTHNYKRTHGTHSQIKQGTHPYKVMSTQLNNLTVQNTSSTLTSTHYLKRTSTHP